MNTYWVRKVETNAKNVYDGTCANSSLQHGVVRMIIVVQAPDVFIFWQRQDLHVPLAGILFGNLRRSPAALELLESFICSHRILVRCLTFVAHELINDR